MVWPGERRTLSDDHGCEDFSPLTGRSKIDPGFPGRGASPQNPLMKNMLGLFGLPYRGRECYSDISVVGIPGTHHVILFTPLGE